MDNPNPYKNLNFSFPIRRVSPLILVLAAAFIVFSLMWWVLPPGALYWLLLPIFLILVWMASYGWRQALTSLVKLLQFILRS